MISPLRHCLRLTCLFDSSFSSAFYCSSSLASAGIDCPEKRCVDDSTPRSDIDLLLEKVRVGGSHDEVLQSLSQDAVCNSVQLSHDLVAGLLHRFRDDWRSALGVFKWASSRSGYEHSSESYDTMVDILGKLKQMDQMRVFLDDMKRCHVVTLSTIGKVMRRFAGAGQWEEAVRIFDELGSFGLEKNTESMNLLLDTLCKERKVEQARAVFLELKSHVPPNANTFNIFINGWCRLNRVDEAYWTIQEMKGYGCRPCIISYSTLVLFHCRQNQFDKVYELFDEMVKQGCPPNVVTYTTVMSSLAKLERFGEAIEVARKMDSTGCKPDVLFYNSLIHSLGRAGKVKEAIEVFEVEMRNNGISPNTSTYNTMIAMFCHQGQEQKALNLLKAMERLKLCKPDVQTYFPLLKSCFKTGKVGTSLSTLLDDMAIKHHLSLDASAYTLLIHGLCRANRCEWAYRLFEEMIAKDMTPRYRTCLLLWKELEQQLMYESAQKVAAYMEKL
ncbi:hypothetical protein K2173_002675 [Erythroxylum novogranatense]|uniref:Pentatricopeptide repeat-containing protein n=1 Tax=Erythroxylum novogranatense TaxID=1862640 RepID=A0AAV8SXN6_9ROSI|nr:hypothetical protein K2173_002675 [Erythroxylum novogranatense]